MNRHIPALLLTFLAPLLDPIPTIAQPVLLDRTLAVVGNEPILLSDLNDKIEFYVFNNRIDPNTPGLRERVLQDMINQKLIFAKALEDSTIAVTEDEVDNHLNALITQAVQQVGSEKRLEEIYRMPISRMKREWRDEQRKDLITSRLIDVKFGSIQPSRREVEEFFAAYEDSLPQVQEELELYHILRIPKVSESMKGLVKEKAQKVLDSIKAGGDFADFARRYSDDAGTAGAGGDLGPARRGIFVKEFEETVFALQDSQYADIVETIFGFHIIQLLERRGESAHARHILLKIQLDSAAIDTTKQFLLALRDSARSGANFMDLAKRYSEDKESASLGGSLGRYTVDRFDPSLIRIVNTLGEGEISGPVEVQTGTSTAYQIVLLKRRVPAHQMNLADDWQRLEQLAAAYKKNAEYQRWIEQLHEEIRWEVRAQ